MTVSNADCNYRARYQLDKPSSPQPMTDAGGNQRAFEVAGGLLRCSKATHCAALNKN